MRIGIDPWLLTVNAVRRFEEAANAAGAVIVRLDSNPVDAIWTDRPSPPLGQVFIQPIDYAGRTVHDKLEEIEKAMWDADAKACILTDPSSVAWCFNIRGSDVPHTPHPLAFAIIEPGARSRIFIDRRKLDPATTKALGKAVTVREPKELPAALDRLGKRKAAVRLDFAGAAQAIYARLKNAGATPVRGGDPCVLPKSKKNKVEI